MDIKDSVMQAIDIVKLDENTIDKVSKDKEALKIGIIIIAIGSFLTALANYIGTKTTESTINLLGIEIAAAERSISSLIAAPIGSIIGIFIGVGVLFIIAKLFRGKATFMELFTPIAFASIISWLGILNIIPFVGGIINFIAGIWSIVVTIIIVRKIYSFGTGKAVIVVLIPLVILVIIATILAVITALFVGMSVLG